jgi:uncharacterized membrane protein
MGGPEAGDAHAPGAQHPALESPEALARRLAARRQVLFWARASFVLVGTMPWWVPLVHALVPAIGELLAVPFMFVCHRLPERTLHVAGEAMPLCSRCAGIFTGLAAGALTCWPRLSLPRARIALAVGGVLMLADVVTQDLGVHPVWHSTRLLTGALLGYTASAALMSAIIREGDGPPASGFGT